MTAPEPAGAAPEPAGAAPEPAGAAPEPGLAPAAVASLTRILALAVGGFRQAVRDKVLYVLAAACAVLISGSVLVALLTLGERARIVLNLGLSATSLLSILTAVFVGVNQAAREIERRTLDAILSKPVARWEFLTGRFLGLAATLALMVAVMGILHAGLLAFFDGYRPAIWTALLLAWLAATLTAAIALFTCTFMTTIPAMFMSLGLVVIGHASWGLVLLAERVESAAGAGLLRGLYLVLPNLDYLNVRSQVAWNVEIPWTLVAAAAAHALAYSALLIALGAAVLARRDLR